MEKHILGYRRQLMKGDELGALLHAKATLNENVTSLWGPEAKIVVGWENRYAVIFESEERERIIALAKLIQIHTGKGVAIGMIHDVIVDEAFCGQRLDEALIHTLLQYGRETGFQRFDLTCRPSRIQANRPYKKMGFKLVAKAYKDGFNLYQYIF